MTEITIYNVMLDQSEYGSASYGIVKSFTDETKAKKFLEECGEVAKITSYTYFIEPSTLDNSSLETDNANQKTLDGAYENILKFILGGTIYGIPVTLDNLKALVVSAFFYNK